MPFLKVGMNVLVDRRAVKITGVGNSGLKGKLVTGDRRGDTVYFHPTWETAYCDENWNVLHDYRSEPKKTPEREIKIQNARISPLYNIKLKQPAGYHLEFREVGKRYYKGFSLDRFDTKEGATLALKMHNEGKRVYHPSYFKGEAFICEATD